VLFLGWESSTDLSQIRTLGSFELSHHQMEVRLMLTQPSGCLMRVRRIAQVMTTITEGYRMTDDECAAPFIFSAFARSLCVFVEVLQAAASTEVAKQCEEGARKTGEEVVVAPSVFTACQLNAAQDGDSA
jgi:hypothetical protein